MSDGKRDKAVGTGKAAGPGKKPPAPPRPRPEHPLSAPERTTTRIATELEMRLENAQDAFTSGKAANLDAAGLRAMIASLERNRAELDASIVALPSGAPIMMQAFKLQDETSAMIARLEQLERSVVARAETKANARSGDNEPIHAAAAAKAPAPYCESNGNGDAAHCGLDEGTRRRYRDQIGNIVLLSHTNWSLAINAKHVEERIRKSSTSFEQKLGQALLDMMFAGLGSLAKLGAGKLADKHPEKATAELVKSGANASIKAGVGAVKKAVVPEAGGHKSAKQLHDVAVVQAPGDRESFLQVMKTAPNTWSNAILSNVPYLYDEDLEALFVGLPDTAPSQLDFETMVDDLLKRFDEQVLAVRESLRPIGVVMADGHVRSALVRQDARIDPSLAGESRYAMVPTGKMRFVRWVDDDMAGMAQSRAEQLNAAHVMREAHRFDDAAYWSEDSLARIDAAPAASMRVAPGADPLISSSQQ